MNSTSLLEVAHLMIKVAGRGDLVQAVFNAQPRLRASSLKELKQLPFMRRELRSLHSEILHNGAKSPSEFLTSANVKNWPVPLEHYTGPNGNGKRYPNPYYSNRTAGIYKPEVFAPRSGVNPPNPSPYSKPNGRTSWQEQFARDSLLARILKTPTGRGSSLFSDSGPDTKHMRNWLAEQLRSQRATKAFRNRGTYSI